MSDDKLVSPLMRDFMKGQFANLFKFALWWVSLAPLTFALLDGSTTAIGVGRIVYNAALCLTSPIGGIVVERAHPKTILTRAAKLRWVIWCILVPLTWVLFDSSLVTVAHGAVYVLFNIFLFFDGIAVGLSTVLDIDLCGVDVMGGTYGLEITDDDRNQFNSRQEFFFASCFVIMAPVMAFIGLGIHKAFDQADGSVGPLARQSGTLVAIFFVVFMIATLLQLYYFGKLPEDGPEQQAPPQINDSTEPKEPAGGSLNAGEPEGPPPSLGDQLRSIPSELAGSVAVICQNPPVLWRLVFLGLEIAFEDAAIVVIASQMGIVLPWLGNGDSVWGNIWTAIAVACGKFGGVIASTLMMKKFTPPEQPMKFIPVFALITLSCVFVFGFPLIADGARDGTLGTDMARFLYCLCFFMYFFISTLPKLGLMCLFQSMVSQIENGPRVFGFVAIVATTFDAGVIMVLSVLFVQYDVYKALWITAGIYMGHGVLELITGPFLVLRPMQKMADAAAGGKSEVSPLLQQAEEGKKATEGEDEEGAAGTFSQKTAAVAISSPNEASSPMYAGSQSRLAPSGSVRHAVLSTSAHSASVGFVNRSVTNAASPRGAMSGLGRTPREEGTYMRTGSVLQQRTGPSGSPRSPAYGQ